MQRSNEYIDNSLWGIHFVQNLRPYQVDEADDGSVTYMRFHPGDADGNNLILRITVEAGSASNTITTTEIAVGKWEERDTLTYEPVNGSEDQRFLGKGHPKYTYQSV